MPRFIHNAKFDRRIDELPGVIWYPYVGADFENGDKRLMVLAHNVPVGEEVHRQRREEMEQKPFWTGTLDEYTYTAGWWTKAFRSFVKGATALNGNFDERSEESVIQRVDSFVRRIAHSGPCAQRTTDCSRRCSANRT
jgi:hypothetical protein